MAEIAIFAATAALRKAINLFGDQIFEAGSRLFKLKQDILWIASELEFFQVYLENFDDDTSNTIEVALIQTVRLLVYDVEDVLESYMVKIAYKEQKGSLGWIKKLMLANPRTAHKLSLEIEDIKKRIEEVNRRRHTYGITPARKENTRMQMDERRSFPHTEEYNIVDMDDKVKKLKAHLLNNDLSHLVVAITGGAGLGKTTLMRKVYNSLKENYHCSAWICVTQQPNISELLRDVSRQVGLAEKKWKHNTESNLFEFLREKRYIIAIDDLWHNRSWDALKNGIPTNNENGSRIILTSRYKNVGEYVGGKSSMYELEPLNKVESKKLFFNILNGNANADDRNLSLSLLAVAELILDKCNGIPLAIVLTSGMLLLRERADYAWMGVLESMGQKDDECSQIFELSYKDLPSKLRPCFLYLGLFPEDYKIKASSLINLWAAERFIEGSEVREVEDVGEDYLNQLVLRNLVQVYERKFSGRIKTCHIHDILHGLCVRVAKDICFFSNKSDLDSNGMIVTKVRRLANYDASFRDYISLGETPKLRALLLFHSCKDGYIGEEEFKEIWNLAYLRVLCLGKTWVFSFSRTIGNLINLTYIQFNTRHSTKVPSAIGNLRSLMTLDARDSPCIIIPSCIWEMKCLRHLLLGYEGRIEYPFYKSAYKTVLYGNNLDVCAINLRTLYTLYLPYEEPDFSPKKYQLPNLRKLRVRWDIKNEHNIIKLIEDAPKIEVLELLSWYDSQQPFDIGNLNLHRYEKIWKLRISTVIKDLNEQVLFPFNMTKLIFTCTELREDPMEFLKKLPKLKFLRFGYSSYIGKKIIVSSGGDEDSKCNFPHLEVLQIHLEYGSIRELVLEEPTMPYLKNLSIKTKYRITVDASQRIQDKIMRFDFRFKKPAESDL